MREGQILQQKLIGAVGHIHLKSWRAIWDVVEALLDGRVLQLTRLGRHLDRDTSQKHRIKAIDRILGSTATQCSVAVVYRELAHYLLTGTSRPTILVDWTQIRGSTHALTAAVPLGGRAIPILIHIYEHAQRPKRKMHKKFLRQLAEILPAFCIPVLVTDAEFQSSWVQDVQSYNWYFVARLRHKTCVRPVNGGAWQQNKTLHALATRKAKDLGTWQLVKDIRAARVVARLVIAKRPTKKRHCKGRSGQILKGGMSIPIRAQNNEPWLLATNLPDPCEEIVNIYAKRMKIEQTFRDAKSPQFGWSLAHIRTTDAARLSVLLLIATLAFVVTVVLGMATRAASKHRLLQANTSKRTVLSLFQIGLIMLTTRPGFHIEAMHRQRALKILPLDLWMAS